MPSPERGGQQPEENKRPEQEPTPYYRAARFRGERLAGRAYTKAQEAIFRATDSDLSAYRLILNELWHVAVLGEPPPQDLDQKLAKILSTGEPTTLPDEILKLLQERQAQARKQAPWVERHFRYPPGKQL